MPKTFGWLDINRIAEQLADAHPGVDPLRVRFTDLRTMVEALADFAPDPAHPVNEKILESIQMAWHDERLEGKLDEEDDEDDHHA